MRFDVMESNGRPRRPTCPPKLQSHWLKYVGVVRPLFAWVTSGVWFSFNTLSSSDLCPVCRLVLVGHILRILLGSWHWGRPELCPLTNRVLVSSAQNVPTPLHTLLRILHLSPFFPRWLSQHLLLKDPRTVFTNPW